MIDWIPLKFGEEVDVLGNPMWELDDRLEDHYYYLVVHKAFATPMKAKFHMDTCPYFEILSYNYKRLENWHNFENVYQWDDSITHFALMPDLPYNPKDEIRQILDDFWDERAKEEIFKEIKPLDNDLLEKITGLAYFEEFISDNLLKKAWKMGWKREKNEDFKPILVFSRDILPISHTNDGIYSAYDYVRDLAYPKLCCDVELKDEEFFF